MADFTASTALRNALGVAAAGFYYWVTLHDATGGFVAGDTYSAGVRGELPTANGYTRGEKVVSLANTNGVLDGADAVWTAEGGSIGPASYAALWVSATNNITGAGLVSVKDNSDNPQTATGGQPMTYSIVDPITIQIPA